MSKKKDKVVENEVVDTKVSIDETIASETTAQPKNETVESNEKEYVILEQFRDGVDGTVYKAGDLYGGSASEERINTLLGDNVYKRAFIRING